MTAPTTELPMAAAPDAAPAHPTTFGNGRYQVEKLLGEGGKKRVYLSPTTGCWIGTSPSP